MRWVPEATGAGLFVFTSLNLQFRGAGLGRKRPAAQGEAAVDLAYHCLAVGLASVRSCPPLGLWFLSDSQPPCWVMPDHPRTWKALPFSCPSLAARVETR